MMFLGTFGFAGGTVFAGGDGTGQAATAGYDPADPIDPEATGGGDDREDPAGPGDGSDAQKSGDPEAGGPNDGGPNEGSDPAETGAQEETTTAEETTQETVKAETHPVKDLKASSVQFRQIRLTWKADPEYGGSYIIYRVASGKTTRIGATKKNHYTVKNLTPGKKYTYRVRSDRLSGSVSCIVLRMKNAKLSLVKKGGSRWDPRIAAGQKLYGYDTIQGACAYKGFAYMALYDRNKEKVKIIKVRLKDLKIVRKSKPLKCHANTITLDTKRGRLVIPQGRSSKKKLIFVNPKTLRMTGSKTIKISRSKLGVKYKGISGIAFNRGAKKFYIKVMGNSSRVVRYTSGFGSSKRIPITGNISRLMSQGITTDGGYLYDLQSFDGGYHYNLITIRTLSGKMVGRVKVPQGTGKNLFELENLFKDEKTGTWYIGMYRAVRTSGGDYSRKNYIYEVKNIW